MQPGTRVDPSRVTLREVFEFWWPLAASWLLMGFELPAVSAVMARLPHATVSLAAYGGVIFPISLLIEAPIIMLLAASTALSRDWESYALIRRFMWIVAGTLTLLHILVAFTPLYYLVVGRILGAPAEILEPARTGLRIMTPWTLAIAYRRFQQGVLIRFGRSRLVGVGTGVRLAANATVLALGYAHRELPGIVVGTLAVAAGVVCEAVFAGIVVHPVLRDQLRKAPPAADPLTLRGFLRFYVPLALMPLIAFFAMPMGSAAMSRMPRPIESLATWPVVNGLVFTFRSVGFAMNEVVVALLDWPRAVASLRKFTLLLALGMTLILGLAAATPLGVLWFGKVSALDPSLRILAEVGLWISFLMPGLSVLLSWYQGTIVHSRKTRPVTESVILYLGVNAVLLTAGVHLSRITGLYVGLFAAMAGSVAQVLWLRSRAKGALTALRVQDAGGSARSSSPLPAGAASASFVTPRSDSADT